MSIRKLTIFAHQTLLFALEENIFSQENNREIENAIKKAFILFRIERDTAFHAFSTHYLHIPDSDQEKTVSVPLTAPTGKPAGFR